MYSHIAYTFVLIFSKYSKYLRRSTGRRVPAKTAEARVEACGTAMSSLSQARLKVDEVSATTTLKF